jgi:hypothetical protein
LPFQAEISSLLSYGNENTVTVSVDNTLLNTTVPQGAVEELVRYKYISKIQVLYSLVPVDESNKLILLTFSTTPELIVR